MCGRVRVNDKVAQRNEKPLVEEEETTKVEGEDNRICAADSRTLNHISSTTPFGNKKGKKDGRGRRPQRRNCNGKHTQVPSVTQSAAQAHSRSHFADLAPEKHRSHRPESGSPLVSSGLHPSVRS